MFSFFKKVIFGALVLVFFKQPKELGVEVPGKESNHSIEKETKPLTIRELWKIP